MQSHEDPKSHLSALVAIKYVPLLYVGYQQPLLLLVPPLRAHATSAETRLLVSCTPRTQQIPFKT